MAGKRNIAHLCTYFRPVKDVDVFKGKTVKQADTYDKASEVRLKRCLHPVFFRFKLLNAENGAYVFKNTIFAFFYLSHRSLGIS